MVPTCEIVTPYSTISLNVGTMVNVPLCNSLYLFLFILCHPYILYIFAEFLGAAAGSPYIVFKLTFSYGFMLRIYIYIYIYIYN